MECISDFNISVASLFLIQNFRGIKIKGLEIPAAPEGAGIITVLCGGEGGGKSTF